MTESVISIRGSLTQRRNRSITQPTPMPQTISQTTMRRNVSSRPAQRKRIEAHRNDGKTIEDERGGVVGEAFAFEDYLNAARQPQPPDDRQWRHGVRRRDDGAKDKTDCPGKAERKMRRRGDGDGREYDAADSERGQSAED